MSSVSNEHVQVWYVTESASRFPRPEGPQWPTDYAHVASLKVADLKDAYRRTNNIDSSWIKADGVEINEAGCAAESMFGAWKQGDGIRSCSIGDIFRTEGAGAKYRVASTGYDRVYANHLWHSIAAAFSDANTVCKDMGMTISPAFQKRKGLNPCVLTHADLGTEIEVDWLDFTDLVDSGAIQWIQHFSEGHSKYYPNGQGGRLVKTEYRLKSYHAIRSLFGYDQRSSTLTAFQGASS